MLPYEKRVMGFMGLEPLTMWLCTGEVMPKMQLKMGNVEPYVKGFL